MTTYIYAWPPICARGVEFTVEQPYSESISSLNKDLRYVSQSKRERRVATLVISGRNNDGSASGYINALKRLLKGGIHLVRVNSKPSHFNLDWGPELGSALIWQEDDLPIDWFDKNGSVVWVEHDLEGVYSNEDGWDYLTITGFSGPVKIYPDEIVKSGSLSARNLTFVESDGSGPVILRLDGPVESGEVVIGQQDSAIYKLVGMPRQVQYSGEDFEYTIELRQVFEDEIVGPYEEKDPWR